jgi:hypothetical protein
MTFVAQSFCSDTPMSFEHDEVVAYWTTKIEVDGFVHDFITVYKGFAP